MNRKESGPELLKSKNHFEVLDGLRGIAALAIVIFHFSEWIFPDFSKNFIGHGFLAVDFFFCLSGFVIGYAYDNRIEKMGVMEFFKSRLIRLHPLIIVGSILGMLAFLFDPFAGHTGLYSTGKLLLIFICSIFMIPFPVMEERAFNLFSFNAPSWSLFWEYMANIFYALILYRITRRYLIVSITLAAAALLLVSYHAGNLLGGWSGATFWDGGVRIAYSFLTGLFIYRADWIRKNRLGFPGLAILLCLAFVMPYFKWNWLAEFLVVLLYFPLLVSLGAGTTMAPALKKFCQFSGKISYPLYMTHYAAIWMFGNYYTSTNPGTTELTVIVITGTLVLTGFAYVIMTLYDIPLRRYLHNRRKEVWVRRKSAGKNSHKS